MINKPLAPNEIKLQLSKNRQRNLNWAIYYINKSLSHGVRSMDDRWGSYPCIDDSSDRQGTKDFQEYFHSLMLDLIPMYEEKGWDIQIVDRSRDHRWYHFNPEYCDLWCKGWDYIFSEKKI